MTVALAGTNTKGLWDLLTSFFGTAEDKEDVWDFIDPKSRVARPLDLESTDGEEDQGEVSQETAVASTSKVGVTKEAVPRSIKVSRMDVCPLDKAIRIYPADPKHLSASGIPSHLLSSRESRTSGTSGASLYNCVHPDCEPVFVAKGGPTALHNHIRRHHLGMCLACPYCSDRFYYAASGWKTHMEKFHQNLPWYKSNFQPSEEVQAAAMLQQAE